MLVTSVSRYHASAELPLMPELLSQGDDAAVNRPACGFVVV
jgi:hypothetical protein